MRNSNARIVLLISALIGATASADEPKRAGPDWWSLQKLTRPDVPKVNGADWKGNPIDAFVLASLEAKGLRSSPPVDRQTLIRRITFDLTGLPPTPAEVDAFIKDRSDDAYVKLVDRLLASPHYGEHWGRHWLDLARFGESHGFERDQPRDHAWRYRDYVINAFNSDKPYADIIREQLAGDVLPPSMQNTIVATGFLVAGPWDQVGQTAASRSVQIRAREDELEEILGTVGQTFLGMTVNCARCHDHKFDPIPAKDYYRLKAVFDGVAHGERQVANPEATGARQAEMANHRSRIEETQRKIAIIEKRGREKLTGKAEAGDLPRPFAQWTFEGDARDRIGNLHGTLSGGAKIVDGRLLLDGKGAFVETVHLDRDLLEKTLEVWVTLSDLNQRGGGAISVEAAAERLFDAIVFGERQPREWLSGSNNYQRSKDVRGPTETAAADEPIHMVAVYAANGRIALYRNGEAYGESYIPAVDKGKPVTYKAGEAHILIGKRHTGGGNAYLAGSIDEARLYDHALSGDAVRASFKAGIERISPQQMLMALSADDRRELMRFEEELAKLRANRPDTALTIPVYAATVRQPGPSHLLKRGDPESEGEVVTAGPPSSVVGPPADFGLADDAAEGERRRRFAEWVVHRDNPLTWRVMANRIWQHHFGAGIVRTPNDFGFNGERPTHPELLDWLAFTFREEGGSVKKLHRAILLSATYQQAATFDAKAAAVDADNRLLWRYAPRRLEAESVRDALLSISGQLNRQAGGPSFRPFKIEVFNSTFYKLLDVDAPEFNRRSIYRMTVHSARDPLLDVFDCPDPSVKTPGRAATTTPLQALTLMNNSFVNRQARVFAERLRDEAGTDLPAQISLAHRYAFGRAPSAAEAAQALEVAKEHGMRPVCWAIVNASEFVSVR